MLATAVHFLVERDGAIVTLISFARAWLAHVMGSHVGASGEPTRSTPLSVVA